jgi:hypothetical protein
MKGLDFDTFHAFGLNNDIILAEDGSIAMPNRLDEYSYEVYNLANSSTMIMRMNETELANLTDEEIAALINDGWTIG